MVKSFTGSLAFLSNFHRQSFTMKVLGEVKSSEHGFNALKTLDAKERAWVLEAPTPREAKVRGRKVTLRPGWDQGVRDRAMDEVLYAKFQDARLRDRLLATGEETLVEINTWHDQYWGDCTCAKHVSIPGANNLGETLMRLRAHLQKKVGLAPEAPAL